MLAPHPTPLAQLPRSGRVRDSPRDRSEAVHGGERYIAHCDYCRVAEGP